jgi:hypothetical protein
MLGNDAQSWFHRARLLFRLRWAMKVSLSTEHFLGALRLQLIG